jgi:Tfp pilus assembly protein PilX
VALRTSLHAAAEPRAAAHVAADRPVQLLGSVSLTLFRGASAQVSVNPQSVRPDGVSVSEVTVTVNGEDQPVTVTSLQGGYGSQYAISIIPEGWTSQAGSIYRVEVNNIATII